jgi:hypothetical protein
MTAMNTNAGTHNTLAMRPKYVRLSSVVTFYFSETSSSLCTDNSSVGTGPIIDEETKTQPKTQSTLDKMLLIVEG